MIDLTNEDIETLVGVNRNQIVKARKELKGLRLIEVGVATNGVFTYEVLNPDTGLPLATRERRLTKVELDRKRIEKVFMHYLGDKRLEDNQNGMRFYCPFHAAGSPAKQRRHPLNVSNRSESGLWQCTDAKCTHHGRKGKEEITNSFGDVIGELATGGGDLLDFITAMRQKETGKTISREEATTIMDCILDDEVAALQAAD